MYDTQLDSIVMILSFSWWTIDAATPTYGKQHESFHGFDMWSMLIIHHIIISPCKIITYLIASYILIPIRHLSPDLFHALPPWCPQKKTNPSRRPCWTKMSSGRSRPATWWTPLPERCWRSCWMPNGLGTLLEVWLGWYWGASSATGWCWLILVFGVANKTWLTWMVLRCFDDFDVQFHLDKKPMDPSWIHLWFLPVGWSELFDLLTRSFRPARRWSEWRNMS